MNYLSLFSGIEAASVAWGILGWQPVGFAQYDPEHDYSKGLDYPSRVLQHHYPAVPNLGDVTKITEETINGLRVRPDLVVGGSPCQSFSLAGLRNGISDPRGNLALEFLRIVDLARPRWVLYENVPGLLSSGGGRDFGIFLSTLGECGYGYAYRVLDAQFFGVPQRRRRIFVVGYLGDWRPAAAVLFEPKGMSGDFVSRRKKKSFSASFTETGFGKYSEGVGTVRRKGGTSGDGSETLVVHGTQDPLTQVETAFPLGRNNGQENVLCFDARGNGDGNTVNTLTGDHAGRPTDYTPVVVAIQANMINRSDKAGPNGKGYSEDGTMFTLTRKDQHAVAICDAPQAFAQNTRDEVRYIGGDGQTVGTLCSGAGAKQQTYIRHGFTVRRLTPLECERLQGFPDGYTRIPEKVLASKPRTKHFERFPDMYGDNPDGTWTKYACDSHRYAALGNSMNTYVVRWLGRRIEFVETVMRGEV